MALFNFFTKSVVGVDLGASAIKLVKGNVSGNRFEIEHLYASPLPQGCISDRGIEDMATVVAHLRSALESLRQKNPLVATAMKGTGVLTKRIMMPKVPKKEIPQQVRWEAEQVFPTDMSNILISHLLLGEGKNVPLAPPGTPGWDVLLVGVQRSEALNYRDVLLQAGAQVTVMDLDVFASSDLLEKLMKIGSQEVAATVDIGASGTRVGVRHKGNVVFVREFEIGGRAFTEAIAQALGLSFEDAEALKMGREEGAIPQEAQDALAGVLTRWKGELQQCEDIYITQSESQLVERWIIYGGASATPGLDEVLRDDRFGSKVQFVDFDRLLAAKSKTIDASQLRIWGPRLFTVAGLALRGGRS